MVSKTFHALSQRYRTIPFHVPRYVLSGMLFVSGEALLEHCDIGFSVHGTFRSVKFSARTCQLPEAVSGWSCFQVLPDFSGVLNNVQQNTIERVLSFTVFVFSRTAPINAFFSGICKRLPFAIRSRPVDMFPSSIDALAERLCSADNA